MYSKDTKSSHSETCIFLGRLVEYESKYILDLDNKIMTSYSKVYPLFRLDLTLLFCVFIGGIGCGDRPATAPNEFQELSSFLFEHMMDEDPRDLALGLENLHNWVSENHNSSKNGYVINTLTEEAMASIGDGPTSLEIHGGAVTSSSAFSIIENARVLGIDNNKEANGDAYVEFTRTYEGDAECFAQQECLFLTGESKAKAEWGGLIEVNYLTSIEFRWVKTEVGMAMIHRTRLKKRPDLSISAIDIHRSYYMGIVLPGLPDDALSNSILYQSSWSVIDYKILPVSEDYAYEKLVEGLIDLAKATETYMNKYYVD